MPPCHPSSTIDALCAVGRNVVNFQRLERILKQLAMYAPVCATPSTLQRVVETQRAKVERFTLGEAVKKWIESNYHHAPNQNEAPQPEDQARMFFGFEFQPPPEYLHQLSGELESLTQERNSLIHLDLAQMNFEDEAKCIALITQLNAQNERIIRATKFLEPILTQMQEFARLITSDERLIQELVSPTFVEEDAE
jgi:hypothetical protein